MNSINGAVREGSFEIEYRMQTSKRKLVLSFNVLARDRTVFGISVFAKDVTERKKADEALRESEERFRRITENMLDMVVQTDVQGICEYASPSFKTVLGYDPKSMLGKSLFELVHPEDLNNTLEVVLKTLATRSTAKFDYRYKHADGHYVWLQSVGNPLFDPTGEISGTVLATRDITTGKQAEEEARAASLYSRSLIEASLDPLVTISVDGKITDVNKATELVTDVSREQLIGSDFSSYFTDPKKAKEGYLEVFERDPQGLFAGVA